MKEQDKTPEKPLSGDRQSTQERIQSNNDYKDYPRIQERMVKVCFFQRDRKYKEQPELKSTINEMRNNWKVTITLILKPKISQKKITWQYH